MQITVNMPNILAISNNNDILSSIVDILKLADYNVWEADNGKDGIIKARNLHPDLIVCALDSDIIDGYVVLKIIREHEALSFIPFIFVTEDDTPRNVRMGMNLGADDYITKPFSPSELLSALECRLKKAFKQQKYHIGHVATGVNESENSILPFSMSSFIGNRNSRYFRDRQKIYEEGELPLNLYFIIKGRVKTFKSVEYRREFITGLQGEGDFLGHIALLNGGNYNESAEAIGDVILAIIPVSNFEEIISVSSHARRYFIQLLVRNLEKKEAQLLSIAFDSLRKRIADVLLDLNKVFNYDGIKFSRSNLAALVGVPKESFVRMLSEMRDERIVEIRDGIIYIIDNDKLLALQNDRRDNI